MTFDDKEKEGCMRQPGDESGGSQPSGTGMNQPGGGMNQPSGGMGAGSGSGDSGSERGTGDMGTGGGMNQPGQSGGGQSGGMGQPDKKEDEARPAADSPATRTSRSTRAARFIPAGCRPWHEGCTSIGPGGG